MNEPVVMTWQGILIMFTSIVLVCSICIYCIYHLVKNRE